MSELKWIKHDGGPMPVPGDTIVATCSSYTPEGPDCAITDAAENWLLWDQYKLYAIVGDAVADAVNSPAPTDEISDTLAERGNRYGPFDGHAKITQAIKRSYYGSPNWLILPPDMKESLDMIAHKMGRILNGDPNYRDSWIDIVGYAKLISDRLED